MNIFGTFKPSIEIEQALAELENRWISKEHIVIVFMDPTPSPVAMKARSGSLYSNAFEVGIAFATGCAVVGASVGFILRWGPIVWGLIAATLGFGIGFLLYLFMKRKYAHAPQRNKKSDILVIIHCASSQAPSIKDLLWQYKALTVGELDNTW